MRLERGTPIIVLGTKFAFGLFQDAILGEIVMKIILATDGSEFSEAAALKCCDLLCEGASSDITVVSVYEAQAPIAMEPFAISAEYLAQLDNLAKQRAHTAAERAAGLIAEKCGSAKVRIEKEIGLGHPAEVVIEAAKSSGADLIVVGSHGRGFWGRLSLGSVSDAIIHHAPCSVLVVRKSE